MQCGAMFYAPTIRGKESLLSPIFKEFLGIAGSVAPLTAVELLDAWAELDLLRGKMLAEMSRVCGAALPGGECAGVEARRAVLDD